MLEALARQRPLVVVLEDIHWAEPTFLDLVEYLTDWTIDAPILLLCLARPELLEERPGWAGGKRHAHSIVLEPLSSSECDVLIRNLRGNLSAEARARISEAAAGNPLFLEQMLAMLADAGDSATELSVPPTIKALLAARLDRLEPEARALIGCASVVGKEFWRGALRDLSPGESRGSLGGLLQELVRREFIQPCRSTFPGEEALRFRHVLIHDAAYVAVPKDVRAELHERFAGWLERKAG